MAPARLTIDDFARIEPVSKTYLDYHFLPVGVDNGFLVYKNVYGDKYFFESSYEYNNIPMYECNFIIKGKRHK